MTSFIAIWYPLVCPPRFDVVPIDQGRPTATYPGLVTDAVSVSGGPSGAAPRTQNACRRSRRASMRGRTTIQGRSRAAAAHPAGQREDDCANSSDRLRMASIRSSPS